MEQCDPWPDIDALPDIPGTRNRWRRWYSVVLEDGMRMTVEELHGEKYLVPGPPMVTIIAED